MKNFGKYAFTLIEIMVVIIIIGTVASFAIPGFFRTIERAHAREAMNNLILIHASNMAYRSEHNEFWPITSVDKTLAEINTGLNLNIVANGVVYECDWSGGNQDQFDCEARRDNTSSSFLITLDEDTIDFGTVTPATNPQCVVNIGGSCPF